MSWWTAIYQVTQKESTEFWLRLLDFRFKQLISFISLNVQLVQKVKRGICDLAGGNYINNLVHPLMLHMLQKCEEEQKLPGGLTGCQLRNVMHNRSGAFLWSPGHEREANHHLCVPLYLVVCSKIITPTTVHAQLWLYTVYLWEKVYSQPAKHSSQHLSPAPSKAA